MTGNLHLVFSKPPATVGDEQYNDWYDYHLTEILAVPGFRAARRYSVTTHVGTRAPAGYSFLSLYEIDGDAVQVKRNISDSRAARMTLPAWFSGIQFASWTCLLRESYGSPEPGDCLQFVFSTVPQSVTDSDYDIWARQHMARSLAAGGIGSGWRFRAVAANAAAQSAGDATDLAICDVPANDHHPWEPLSDVNQSDEPRPAWWPGQVDVASCTAVALGARVTRGESQAADG